MKYRYRTMVCTLLLATAEITLAQTAKSPAENGNAAPAAYDVVSIRPNKTGSNGMSVSTVGGSYRATNVSAMLLLSTAYGIRQDLISGQPAWVESEHFDVEGKLLDRSTEDSKSLTSKQRSVMMRALLVDRFHLIAHTETRTMPVYNLVVARSGPRLKVAVPTAGDDDKFHGLPPGSFRTSGTSIDAHSIALGTLVDSLAATLERTILDKTGLTERYDFSLQWTPDGNIGEANLPTLIPAVEEQLGLKLESAKGPVETLVIDHIEKPTEN